MRVNFLESNARFNLIGGTFFATYRQRRRGGRRSEPQLARAQRGRAGRLGTMTVQLPFNLNANIDAQVLRVGQIENALVNLKPRDRTKFTEKSMAAKAGNGGAPLSFTVGDGTLKLVETEK
jgi:hypothetical protein